MRLLGLKLRKPWINREELVIIVAEFSFKPRQCMFGARTLNLCAHYSQYTYNNFYVMCILILSETTHLLQHA